MSNAARKTYQHEWYMKNKKRIAKQFKRQYHNDIDGYRNRSKRYRLALKLDLMRRYGGKCVACKIDELAVLTFDHIHDDGNKDKDSRSGGGVFYLKLNKAPLRSDLQILCFNCQLRKRIYGPNIDKWPNQGKK